MYAKDVQDIIDYGTSGHVAGIIAEAIQVMVLFSSRTKKTTMFFTMACILLTESSISDREWVE